MGIQPFEYYGEEILKKGNKIFTEFDTYYDTVIKGKESRGLCKVNISCEKQKNNLQLTVVMKAYEKDKLVDSYVLPFNIEDVRDINDFDIVENSTKYIGINFPHELEFDDDCFLWKFKDYMKEIFTKENSKNNKEEKQE